MVEYLGPFWVRVGYWDLGSISSVLLLSTILCRSVGLCRCVGVCCAKCYGIACIRCSFHVNVIHNTPVAIYKSLLQLEGVQDNSRATLLLSISIELKHNTQSGITIQ